MYLSLSLSVRLGCRVLCEKRVGRGIRDPVHFTKRLIRNLNLQQLPKKSQSLTYKVEYQTSIIGTRFDWDLISILVKRL